MSDVPGRSWSRDRLNDATFEELVTQGHIPQCGPDELNTKSRYDQLAMPRLKNVKADPDGQFSCRWKGCTKRRKDHVELKRHLRTHVRPVICPSPNGGGFVRKHRKAQPKDMDEHIKVDHHGERTLFRCEDCPPSRTFTRRDNLMRHRDEAH